MTLEQQEPTNLYYGLDDFFKELNEVVAVNHRRRVMDALLTACSRAAEQKEVEVRVWLDPEDWYYAQVGLHLIRQRFLFDLYDKKKSTKDTLELVNGSAVILRLKAPA